MKLFPSHPSFPFSLINSFNSFAVCLVLLLALNGGCARHHDKPASAEVETPYHSPLVSPGTAFASLPPAVRNTVISEAGGADIDRVVKGAGAGHTVYVIYFRNSPVFPPLYVGPDGSVLNPDLSVAVPAPSSGTNHW